MEVRKSAQELRALWVLGNEYLQEAAPWSTFKTDPETAAMQVRLALNLIRVYAVISQPFIPDAAQAIMEALGSDDWSWPGDMGAALAVLAAGHGFTTPEVLCAKITDEQREGWEEAFSGVRA
jgi:methionyl-tRNA synthetase